MSKRNVLSKKMEKKLTNRYKSRTINKVGFEQQKSSKISHNADNKIGDIALNDLFNRGDNELTYLKEMFSSNYCRN